MARRIFLSFLLIALAVFPFSLRAEPLTPKPEVETILRQIENRHYRWVAIRADVILFFVSPDNARQAMCGGELLYQRLDERMLLSCYDSNKNLVFTFRALDRRFDLYLPSQNTLYHGSIFDLEDSPEIESHLKLIDLYRALKPGMFDPLRTDIDTTSDIKISLNAFGNKDGERYLARRAYVTPAGDVVGELFFDQEGQVLTEIQRLDFQEIKERVGSFKSIFFPKKITIVSPVTGQNTAIFFNKVKPLDSIDTIQFLLRAPRGVREVFLKERDPRFSLRAIEADQVKPGVAKALEQQFPPIEGKMAPVQPPEKQAEETADTVSIPMEEPVPAEVMEATLAATEDLQLPELVTAEPVQKNESIPEPASAPHALPQPTEEDGTPKKAVGRAKAKAQAQDNALADIAFDN